MATHTKKEFERFKGPSKYIQYILARGCISVLQRLPIGFACRLGRCIGWVAYNMMPVRRRIVRQNLEIVNIWISGINACPEEQVEGIGTEEREFLEKRRLDRSEADYFRGSSNFALNAQVKEVFRRSFANLFCGFTFNRMSAKQIERHVQFEGLEHLQVSLAEGKGTIVLLAHMGPWEALAQLPGFAARFGIDAPFGAMYRPLNNVYLDNWFKGQRESNGTRLFSRRDGFHKPVDFVRKGGMLGILADQKMREGPSANYFGKKVPTSPIAGLFHRRTHAPLLKLSVVTTTPTHWRLSLSPVLVSESVDLKNREALAEICNQAVADSLAESPLDGFWLHKRF